MKNNIEGINKFEPNIIDKDAIKKFTSRNRSRLLISACDIEYFENNFECLTTYKNSNATIPYLVLIFLESPEEEDVLRQRIAVIEEKIECEKIFLGLFSCNALMEIKEDLGDAAFNSYRANYIRCARFLMVSKIWKILGINKQEAIIKEACTYIMDFDNYVLKDFNSRTKIQYGDKKAVFCWNSSVTANKEFPNLLSSFSVSDQGMKISYSYKIVKAGFTALSPSRLTSTILDIFKFYAIGPNISDTYQKLFCFYYGDQISILSLLRDIKDSTPKVYYEQIGWIDAKSSEIACLKRNQETSIYMPKGQTGIN